MGSRDRASASGFCGSGHMARYDVNTGEFLHVSSAEAPAKRGSYPHTLRIDPKDPEGLIWYTDSGRTSVFSLLPTTRPRSPSRRQGTVPLGIRLSRSLLVCLRCFVPLSVAPLCCLAALCALRQLICYLWYKLRLRSACRVDARSLPAWDSRITVF